MPMSISMGMSMSNVGSPLITLPKKVSKILSKYNATMLLPGVSGALRFGYQPGNYRESTGQTLAAADQQVGLVVDAAGVPGQNVAPALEAANWGVVGTDATHVVTWLPGGGLRYQSDTTSPALTVLAINRLVVGRTYVMEITCSAYVGGGLKTDSVSGGLVVITGLGTQQIVFVASTTQINFLRSAPNTDLTISNVSVRELPGIHASQSTSGFQPVLRNTSGIQSWQFDGTDDRLSLSAVPFQTQDVSFAITAFTPSVSDALARRLWEISGNGSESFLSVTSGNVLYQEKGDSGSIAAITATGYGAASVMRVASCVNTGSSRVLRIDGIERGSAATVVANSTANSATLGNRAAGDRALSGFKHLQIFGKGSTPPTEAELLTLERWAASLQGRTL